MIIIVRKIICIISRQNVRNKINVSSDHRLGPNRAPLYIYTTLVPANCRMIGPTQSTIVMAAPTFTIGVKSLTENFSRVLTSEQIGGG